MLLEQVGSEQEQSNFSRAVGLTAGCSLVICSSKDCQVAAAAAERPAHKLAPSPEAV